MNNNKKLQAFVLIVLVIVALGVYKFNKKNTVDDDSKNQSSISSHDATYKINGQNVTLVNGMSQVPSAPGSASMTTTKYFGNEVVHDLNDDGINDSVFLITQEAGGSGIFYYVVAKLNNPTGVLGSEAIFLGDRIAPQSTNMEEGTTTNGTTRKNVIVVNYADRNPGESFAVQPSLAKSIWLKLDPKTMQFGEVAQNFEGESN